ncbi:MAG: SusD/RagB family nutrient-binding outer membrane lipoprotein [Prolixibacteraceae bacterium]
MKQLNFINKYTAFLFILVLIMSSCTDEFEDFNTNKTKLMDVTDKELAGLFTTALIEGNCELTSNQYSRWKSNVTDHFSGYCVIGGVDREQNVFQLGHQQSVFSNFYSKAIPAIVAIQTNSVEKNPVAYHVAMIWKGYIMHRLVDSWGPLPYTAAGNGSNVIPYESVKDVYDNIFRDVTAAVDYLTAETTGNSGLNVFGEGDIVYGGNVIKWIKFANTLRLRMACRISNIDPNKAKTEAEAAVKGPLMDSNDDDAYIADVPSFNGLQNGMCRIGGWHQNSMSTCMESILKGYNDPRMQEYFSVVKQETTSDHPEIMANIGGYHGLTPGFTSADIVAFKLYSNFGPRWVGPDVVSTAVPINVANAAETYFLKAEGAWRGWNMGGSAQSFYEKGIEVSIRQWRGASFPATDITAYINSMATPVAPDNYPYYDPPMTDIPVKFAASQEDQYEQIITQKWLALYPDSWEAWNEYRRTRLPKLYPKKNSMNPNIDVTRGMIVTRLPYPENERTGQVEEYEKAVELLGGPDLESTPLWWDVNKNGN